MLLIRWEGLGSLISTCALQHEDSVRYSPLLAGPEPDPLSNPEHDPRSGSSPGCSSRRSTTRVASWTGCRTTVTRTRAAWFQARGSWDACWHGKPRAAHTQRVRRRSCRRTHRHHATAGQPTAEHSTSVRQSWPRLVCAGADGGRVFCNPATVRSRVAYGVERWCSATCCEQRPRAGRRGGSIQRRRVPGPGPGGASTKHPLEDPHMPVWLSPPLLSSRSLDLFGSSTSGSRSFTADLVYVYLFAISHCYHAPGLFMLDTLSASLISF